MFNKIWSGRTPGSSYCDGINRRSFVKLGLSGWRVSVCLNCYVPKNRAPLQAPRRSQRA